MLEPHILREEWLGTRQKKKVVKYTLFINFNYFCCGVGKYKQRSHTLWKIGEITN